jgi:Chaperone of endosialidase
MKRWLALGVSWSFLYLVGNNRRTKPQTKKKEITPMHRVITSHYSLFTTFRWQSYCILTALALGLFALPQRTQAVSPAPDGGYPGQNTAEGQSALLHLVGGTYNTALGWASLGFNVTGNFNTGVGAAALLNNTADNNTATGAGALLSNTTGTQNTADGAFALSSNTGGDNNTANGLQALRDNTTGNGNTAIGDAALQHNTHGSVNVAVGAASLASNTTGQSNTAVGTAALQNATGSNNTAIGDSSGLAQDTGSGNVYIGAGINGVAGESDTCRIRSIFGQTAANGSAVFITSGNKVGTDTSSKRFKDDIKPMERTSEALFALRPVTFRYKKALDPQGVAQFGLVAEEVEKVNPDLIVRDKKGKPYSVRYDQVNAMLLNEFLKEHRTVQELKSEMAALTATVKEQAAEIQKVSAKAGSQRISIPDGAQ